MLKRRFATTLLLVVAGPSLLALPARAATTTASFLVTATILPVCVLTTSGAVVFPDYTAAAVTSFNQIGVLCTNSTTYTIGLSAGLATAATTTTRRMQNGQFTIAYQLFSDASYTRNWGNTPGSDTVGGTGTGVKINYPVYGRIPAGQYVTPGSYSDTIVVTLSY